MTKYYKPSGLKQVLLPYHSEGRKSDTGLTGVKSGSAELCSLLEAPGEAASLLFAASRGRLRAFGSGVAFSNLPSVVTSPTDHSWERYPVYKDSCDWIDPIWVRHVSLPASGSLTRNTCAKPLLPSKACFHRF